MNTTIRILAIFLLLFLGFGGIYGGIMLIADPGGGNFDWSMDLLNTTPFKSFLIPGILLLIANGLFPLYVALVAFQKKSYAGSFILLQGVVVFVWLSVQLIMNPDFFLPETHYPSYAVAFLLLIFGLILRRQNQASNQLNLINKKLSNHEYTS